MGQTLISKYQGMAPSRQEVDERLSDLLQLLHDRHYIANRWNGVHDSRLAKLGTREFLQDLAEKLGKEIRIKKKEKKAILEGDKDWSGGLLLPPLASPPDGLFFYHCKRCLQTPAAASSQFALALPSRCNHPLCPRCLRSELTILGTDHPSLIELHVSHPDQPSFFLHHALLCPVCGLASDSLLFFEPSSRHLLLPLAGQAGFSCWQAKLDCLMANTCYLHGHLFASHPSTVFKASGADGRRLDFSGAWPPWRQLEPEMDFWAEAWLATAKRHFQAVTLGGNERSATLKIIRYLSTVVAQLGTNMRAGSKFPENSSVDEEEETDEGGQLKKKKQKKQKKLKKEVLVKGEEELAKCCQICLQSVLAANCKWAMLDCCSHRFCAGCICKHFRRLVEDGLRPGSGTFMRCPTCRQIVKKFLYFEAFYEHGSARKAAIFRQNMCIDELLESVMEEKKVVEVVVAKEQVEVQIEEEKKVPEEEEVAKKEADNDGSKERSTGQLEEEVIVAQEEEEVEQVIVQIEEEIAAPEVEEKEVPEEDSSDGQSDEDSSGRLQEAKPWLTSLWRLLTAGCATTTSQPKSAGK